MTFEVNIGNYQLYHSYTLSTNVVMTSLTIYESTLHVVLLLSDSIDDTSEVDSQEPDLWAA